MRIAELRRIFERVETLTRDERDAIYRVEGLDPPTIDRVENMLVPVDQDTIARVIGAAAERALAWRLPERIGPWRVLRQIGEGGMGIVLLAERDDGEYERTVAIKLIRGLDSSGARERVHRERQALAALEHPNIAGLIDAGTTQGGDAYLVMPYVEGLTLGAWTRGDPSLATRLRVFVDICRAVHHAHSHLLVHRDIKPGNVIVREDDSPVLLDFGIAKLLDADQGGGEQHTVTRVMTSAYASPEQLMGRPVTTATDVFALGLLLYELLAGSLPKRGDLLEAATAELPPPSVHAAQAERPARPINAAHLRGDLDRVVRRAVRNDPQQRYPSAQALADDIEAFLDGRPVQAAGRHGWYLTRRFVQRHRWLVTAAGIAAIALAAVSMQWRIEADNARQAEFEALQEAAAASEITEFLLALFAELDPDQYPGRQLSARQLLDIGRQRLDEVGRTGPELAERLQAGLGRVYAGIGEPLIAIDLLERLDPDLLRQARPALRMQIQLALARAYRDAVRPESTERAALKALSLARALSPPDRLAEAEALMYRGVAEQRLLRPDDAQQSFIDAQRLYEAQESLAGLSSVLHNRGWLAEEHGDNHDALARYDEALEAKRQIFEPDHPKVLNSLQGRGRTLARLGRHAEAAKVFADVVERTTRVFGPEASTTTSAQGELASIYHDLGRYREAQTHYEQTLAVEQQRSAGAPSMQIAIFTNNLATLLEDRGEVAGALALYRRSIEMRERLLPEGHAGRSNPMHNLARLLLASGDLEAATDWIDRALALRRGAFDSDHPSRLSSELLRARILADAGELAQARAAMASIAPLLATRIDEQPRLAIDYGLARAGVAAAANDPLARLEAFNAAISASIGLHGVTHPQTARLQLQRARARLEAGDAARARAEAAAAVAVLDTVSASTAPWRSDLDGLALD